MNIYKGGCSCGDVDTIYPKRTYIYSGLSLQVVPGNKQHLHL